MIMQTSKAIPACARRTGCLSPERLLVEDDPAFRAEKFQGDALRDARPKRARFLQEYEIAVRPLAAAHGDEATEAFLRFGRGRHPAALNYGDCTSYAVSKLADQPRFWPLPTGSWPRLP